MDETEEIRKGMIKNSNLQSREALEADYGQVWDTQELSRDFQVIGFMAPFVAVIRKSDNKSGSLMFQHSPRFYFGFQEG